MDRLKEGDKLKKLNFFGSNLKKGISRHFKRKKTGMLS
jgi:hypothetical protein